jgi:hypothetical protein
MCPHIPRTPPPQHALNHSIWPVPLAKQQSWRRLSDPRRPPRSSLSTIQIYKMKKFSTVLETSISRRTLTSSTGRPGTPRLPTFAWTWAKTPRTAPSTLVHPHTPVFCHRRDLLICIQDGSTSGSLTTRKTYSEFSASTTTFRRVC